MRATPYQELHLIASEISEDPRDGVLTFGVRFDRALPDDCLQPAWDAVLRRFAGLRAWFSPGREAIEQRLRPVAELPPQSRQVRPATGPVPDPPLRSFGPALLQLVRLPAGEAETRLLLHLHHALVDEESVVLILRQLHAAAAGERVVEAGEAALADRLRVVERQLAAVGASAPFWRRQFAAPVQPWSTFRPVPDGPADAAHHREPLDAATVNAIRATARRHRVSVPMLAHAALAVLGHRYGVGGRVPVGTPFTLRDHPGIGFGEVGLFVNVLPVLVEVTGRSRLAEVLYAARQAQLELHEHKWTPLARLHELAGVDRAAITHSRWSYFGITLAVHDDAGEAMPAGLSFEGRSKGSTGSPVNVDLTLRADGGRLTVSRHAGGRAAPTVAAMSADLLDVLAAIGADADRTVDELDLVDRTSMQETSMQETEMRERELTRR